MASLSRTFSRARSAIIVSLLAWGAFLASGSDRLTSALTSLSAAPETAEKPKGPEVAPPAESVTLDAAEILAQAQSMVERAEWLFTEVRQECRDKNGWSSRGTLQRGPKGCCRLDVSVARGGRTSRVIFVSDGRVLARSSTTQSAIQGSAKVEAWPLPDDVAARDTMLVTHNCGGPGPILAQARARGSQWTAQLAVHAGRPSIAVAGTLPTPTAGMALAKNVRLFLDAETLALTRAEWWTDTAEQGGTILLEIEFENTRLNEVLTVEQCIEAFTLRPES